MIPAVFTAILIACSGPAPERCVPIDLGTYATSACVIPAVPAAAAWIGAHPGFHIDRIECKAGDGAA